MPETTIPKRALQVHIRWLNGRDMPEVLAIDAASFAQPWTKDDFLQHLRRRNCIGMVAEVGELVVGFMLYDLHGERLDLLRLAVDPAYRRREVGAQMVEKLVRKLSALRLTSIDIAVRESNLAAQRFFASFGFRAVGVDREHFADTGEDAYPMRFDYVDPADPGF